MNGKTIGYSATGSSSHAALLALLAQEKVNATPTALGGVTASITAGMSGQVDAAWAAMPYGLKDLEEGKIRIISYGKERPVCTEASEDCYQRNRHAHLAPAQ